MQGPVEETPKEASRVKPPGPTGAGRSEDLGVGLRGSRRKTPGGSAGRLACEPGGRGEPLGWAPQAPPFFQSVSFPSVGQWLLQGPGSMGELG